jgi:KDO2-lipid IV(A) lauroyltransferase
MWIVDRIPARLWNAAVAPLAPLCLPPGRRRCALEQMEAALGTRLDPAARRAAVRSMARHYARIGRELVQYARGEREFLRRLVRPAAGFVERVRAAAAGGRGAIVATPHFGNFELMSGWMAVHAGFRGVVVAKRHVNPFIEERLRAFRLRNRVETVYSDESPRKLLRVLKEGAIVGVLPDMDVKHLPGVFVDFFGRPAYTLSGPASLAILAGAPILPAYALWRGEHYELYCEEPIEVEDHEDRETEVLRLTRAWTRAFERIIAAHPDHWAWIHERWKSTPESVAQRRSQGRLRRAR